MALVSRSSLNPNAPLFVPSAMRQVEDFSPEWWDLVTTSTWFHDYWISQHQGEEDVFGYEKDSLDVVGLLPDSIDLDVDEDVLNMEAQFEEFLRSSEVVCETKTNGFGSFGKNADALIKNLRGPMQRGPMEPIKRLEKPVKYVGPKYSPRSIQQPR